MSCAFKKEHFKALVTSILKFVSLTECINSVYWVLYRILAYYSQFEYLLKKKNYRYRGHCPTTKYDYGETYGNATQKYFQDYRSEVLSSSADPYCKGGEFPTYYTHKPETVISNRTRNRDRWLHTPKYSLTNIDFDRKEELKSFDKVCLN